MNIKIITPKQFLKEAVAPRKRNEYKKRLGETYAQKEKRINEDLSDQPEDELLERFVYLTNEKRGDHVSEYRLRMAIRNGRLGTLLRRLDFAFFYQY